MKSIQHKLNKEELSNTKLLKNSFIAGIIGCLSWLSIFVFWIPLASIKKFGRVGSPTFLELLAIPKLYFQSLLVGLSFFVFFYLTLKYKLKDIRLIGILIYLVFYLGIIFLMFFLEFKDL